MSVKLHELVRRGTISSKDATIAGAVALGLVLLLILYIVLIETGLKRKADQLNRQVAEKFDELDVTRKLAKREDALEKELAKVEELVQRFEDMLPTRKELPRLYGGFQEAAGQAGVKVEFIKKQAEIEPSGSPLVTVPYSFSVSGTYHQLATFMNMLEEGARFMKISELAVGEQENGVSKANFTLSTYLFKEESV